MKRVLLTGGSGFLGANLVRRLLGDGHEVHVLLRPQGGRWRLDDVLGDVRVHEADLADEVRVREAVRRARPEWVFHLAAHGGYAWQRDLGEIVRANVVGTANLVGACLAEDFEALVAAGSSSEYGFKDHAPRETEPLEPNSYYAVTKASATLLCRCVARREGRRLTTLRLYSVYGPWEEPARLIPTLIVHALRGTLPPLVHPDVARDFVHVDDVADACVLAASGRSPEPGAIYNVGSGRQTTVREVVDLVRRAFGLSIEPRWGSMPNRDWDTTSWVADTERIREDLDWRPRRSLEEGLRLMSEWLRRDPRRLRRYEEAARA